MVGENEEKLSFYQKQLKMIEEGRNIRQQITLLENFLSLWNNSQLIEISKKYYLLIQKRDEESKKIWEETLKRNPGLEKEENKRRFNHGSKFEGRFNRKEVFVVPLVSAHLFSAFETILSFEQQILAPAITQPQTQPPDFFGERVQIIVWIAVCADRHPFIGKDLAETDRAIEPRNNFMHPLDGIKIDVAAVVGQRVVIVVTSVAAKSFNRSMRQPQRDITFHEVRVIFRRVRRAGWEKPSVGEPKLGPIIIFCIEVAGSHRAHAEMEAGRGVE